MRKIVYIVLIFVLLLTGCQDMPSEQSPMQPTDQVSDEHTDTTFQEVTEDISASEHEIQYSQQTMFAISMPEVIETISADAGVVIFEHRHQTMQLVLQDPDVANKITLDYLNRLDASHAEAEEHSNAAKKQYVSGESWDEQFYDVFYSPTRIDQGLLSLAGTVTSYTGGRPSQLCTAANYNMLTGDVLTLGSILYHADAKASLVDLVIQKAATIAAESQLYDDYADCIADRFSREESFDEDWYFTTSGLSFYFSPYEIAPYSAGIIRIEVPYSELSGVIADEFFPPEKDLLEGTLQINRFSDTELSAYSQIAEVVLEISGERFLLSADGAVSDIRFEIGNWDSSNRIFYPRTTVFATATLTPGDAVMIQDEIFKDSSNLRISYHSGKELHTVLLFQSEDGMGVQLIEYLSLIHI